MYVKTNNKGVSEQAHSIHRLEYNGGDFDSEVFVDFQIRNECISTRRSLSVAKYEMSAFRLGGLCQLPNTR